MAGFANIAVAGRLFQPAPTIIRAEPVALVGTQARAMLHPVRRVVAIYAYNTAGVRVDYPLSALQIVDGYRLARTSGSPVYDFADYAITMSGATYALVLSAPRNPPLTLSLLTYVDYEADYIPPVTIAGSASPAISGRIITAGDSITGGAHTIQGEYFGNDGDGYVGLLRSHFRRQFTIDNFSAGGSSIGQLTSNLSALLATGPSMITVAFGQNDHVGGPAGLSSFQDALNDIVDDCQAASVRTVLIGFMPKNPLWVNYSLDNCLAYNAAIAAVAAAQGVPFVDIMTPWEAIKAQKSHLELTGDNHHHPNNYGARIWFSTILPKLLTGSISSAAVPTYVLH